MVTEYETWMGETTTSLYSVIERMKNNNIGVGLSFATAATPSSGYYFFKITNFSSDDITIKEASVVF